MIRGDIGPEHEPLALLIDRDILESGMTRALIHFNDPETKAYMDFHIKVMGEATLVSPTLGVKLDAIGTMLGNWGNTGGVYDYRNLLGAFEDFIDACP